MKQKYRNRSGIPVLIAPIKRIDDILPVIRAGAKEIYGGIMDLEWNDTLGQYVEMNRRSSYGKRANLNSRDELCEAVRICKENGSEFHLTLNALQIPQKYHDYVKSILKEFAEVGGKKVIISDPTLIPIVLSFELEPIMSSCADIVNVASAEYYREQNCKRIIFPRDMLQEDIEHITEVVPDIEYEAFLINGACRFHDGCCFCMHGTSKSGLCDTLDYSSYKVMGNSIENIEELAKLQHQQFKQSYFRACGLCAMFNLSRCVDSFKIVGRNADLNSVLSDIKLAKQNLEIALECSSEEEYRNKMIKPKDEDIRCKNHNNCYYLLRK